MAGEKLRAFNGVIGETDDLSPTPNCIQSAKEKATLN